MMAFNVGNWRKRSTPGSLKRWDEWDGKMRRRYGFWRTLRWFNKNNAGGRTIVSLHWPHRLCWSWYLGWHPWRKGYDGPRLVRLRASIKYRSATCYVWFGCFRLSWQDYGHMVGLGHRPGPEITWARDHQLDIDTQVVGHG